jgi:hypothetical protein
MLLTLAKERGEATPVTLKKLVKGMERKAAARCAMGWKLVHIKRFVRGRDTLNVGGLNCVHSRQ